MKPPRLDSETGFRGLRVMIVEDDFMIAWDLVDYFTEIGAEVVGPYSSLSAAMDQCDDIDAAVLDVQLRNGQTVYPLADHLAKRGTPFVFYTSCVSEIPEAFDPETRLDKHMAPRLHCEGLHLDVARMLPLLRVAARLLVKCDETADRWVERTLRAAHEHFGERPAEFTMAEWLNALMLRIASSVAKPAT